MPATNEYYYDKQLRKYIVQFCAIFMGIQTEVGKRGDVEPHLISTPIKFASSDRVVAAIKDENTQNKLIRLPIMSAQLVNLQMAPELRKGVATTRSKTYMPEGGIFPNDFKVVAQRMPVPYKALFDLTIFASNQNQHYQILEQILMLFDPIFQIQISDEAYDWAKITTVELVGVNFDESIPAGGDRRIIQTTLSFEVPVHLALPAIVHENFVKDIFLRMGIVSASSETSYEIIADLDSQAIPYEKVFSLDDIDIK